MSCQIFVNEPKMGPVSSSLSMGAGKVTKMAQDGASVT